MRDANETRAMVEYLQKVRSLVTSLNDTLDASEHAEVEHYIDHNEIGEALRLLAWIIVEHDKRISAAALAKLREYADGLVKPQDMPPGLDEHVDP